MHWQGSRTLPLVSGMGLECMDQQACPNNTSGEKSEKGASQSPGITMSSEEKERGVVCSRPSHEFVKEFLSD